MMWSFSRLSRTRSVTLAWVVSAAAVGLYGCAEGSGEIEDGQGGSDFSGGAGGFGGSVGASTGGAGAGPVTGGMGGMGGIVGTGGMGVGGFGGTASTTSSTTTSSASSSSSTGGGTCPGGVQCGSICCTDPLMTGVTLCCPPAGQGNCGVEDPFFGTCLCTDGCP